MTFKLLLCTAVCVVTTCAGPPQCDVGNWSYWSKCKKSKTIDVPRNKIENWKEMKAEKFRKRAACIADGTCPTHPRCEKTKCVRNMAGPFPCHNIDLASNLKLEDLKVPVPEGLCNDLWNWIDRNGDKYAIVGHTHGTAFVRISDYDNPELLGTLPFTGKFPPSLWYWRDVKVIGNYAFTGADIFESGIQIFDLTQLRGLSEDSDRIFVNTAWYDIYHSHNIVSFPERNMIIVVGSYLGDGSNTCFGGLHMVDVSNPENPQFISCFNNFGPNNGTIDSLPVGYIHDAQCVIYQGPDTRYTGRDICFTFNLFRLPIVDITDPTNPRILSLNNYEGAGFTHQGWLTPDQRYLLVDDEYDEYMSEDKIAKTYIWDVSNLEAPVLIKIFRSSETTIDHNQYIEQRGDYIYVYQANYESGCRILILDDQNPEFLIEVGYFDTYPESTTADFNGGVWTCLPLPDGTVIATDMKEGFFILKPDYHMMEKKYKAKAKYREKQRTRKVKGQHCPAEVETVECSDEL